MGRLAGKVAIITGAASGMGEKDVEIFLKEGAKVVATDINNEKVKEYNENTNEDLAFLNHDVTSSSDWNRIIEFTMEKYGKIDILVNNAGLYIPHKFEDFTVELWHKMMNVNALGVMLGMQNVIPHMLENGGSIVNISSVDANIGTGNSYIYTASKGAVRSLTKKIAIDYAENNIRVNSIHPGLIITPMTYEQIYKSKGGSHAQFNTPLPFIGNPEDVSYGVVYLASDEARYITGSELIIDGGIMAI